MRPHRTAPLPTILVCALGGLALARPAPTVPRPDAAPPGAQEPGAQEGDERARDLRRVLQLADGSFLRARTRFVEGRWEQRVGPDWVPVEGDVRGQRAERELVAEARRMAAGLGRDDHARRAELARWMAGQGLAEEALAELDHVLARAPEHPAALAVLRQAPLALALEPEPAQAGDDLGARLTALVKAGAAGAPARRELAVMRLAEWGERVDLRPLVELELERAGQPRRRAFAGLAARRLYPGELREPLQRRAILDGMGDVREQAALALREARDLSVIGPSLRALGSESTNVRANAAETLGTLGYDAAVEPLMSHLSSSVAALQGGGGPSGTRANLYAGLQTAYISDYDVEIAQSASIADPIVAVQPSGVVFDVRSTVSMSKVIELKTVMRSLRRLTGQDIPDDPARWQAWWDEHGDEWRAVDRAEAWRAANAAATDGRTAAR